jgi:hypothetical protein
MLERCPFFVPTYEFRPAVNAPYVSVSGGLREAALAMPSHQTPLVKTPLVRAGRGIFFWSSSHKISPAVLAHSTCALLHFKFIGDFLKRAKAEVARGQHAAGACDYRRYVEIFTAPPRTSSGVLCERFTSVAQLEALGLIVPPLPAGE